MVQRSLFARAPPVMENSSFRPNSFSEFLQTAMTSQEKQPNKSSSLVSDQHVVIENNFQDNNFISIEADPELFNLLECENVAANCPSSTQANFNLMLPQSFEANSNLCGEKEALNSSYQSVAYNTPNLNNNQSPSMA